MNRIDDRYIVIFDGLCNFCNGAVNFIIRRDPDGLFVFSPMQSSLADQLMQKHNINSKGVDTFLLIKNGQAFTYTAAALEVAKDLKGHWYIFGVFRLVPRVIRDFFYKLFARNRYRLFGKQNTCMVPDKALRTRFLESETY